MSGGEGMAVVWYVSTFVLGRAAVPSTGTGRTGMCCHGAGWWLLCNDGDTFHPHPSLPTNPTMLRSHWTEHEHLLHCIPADRAVRLHHDGPDN